MILGFAHITKNVPHCDGRSVANAPEKWPLMERRARCHEVALLPYRPGWPTEEQIEYDTGLAEGKGRLGTFGNHVVVSAREAKAEKHFLAFGLGCGMDEDGVVEIPTHVPKWRMALLFRNVEDAPIDPPLDIAGYAALAFYSSDVEADRDHLLKHGGRTPTEPFTVKLDREMKIIMLRSPEGTIIELIQVLK